MDVEEIGLRSLSCLAVAWDSTWNIVIPFLGFDILSHCRSCDDSRHKHGLMIRVCELPVDDNIQRRVLEAEVAHNARINIDGSRVAGAVEAGFVYVLNSTIWAG
jgi:hypothetical protein